MSSNTALFLICISIWGSTWIAITFQLGRIDPAVSVSYRFLLAAAILFAYCRWRGLSMHRAVRDHLFLAAQGILMFSLSYICVYYAETLVVSGLVAVGFSAMPLLNMLGVRVAIGTPITVRVALGGLLGIAGIVLVFSPELRSLGADAKVIRGALFTALAVVTAAGGTVVAARNAHEGVPVWQGMAFAMFYGAVFSLLFAIASSRPLEFDWSLRYLGSLLYLAVFGSIIAFGRLSHAAGPHRRGTRRLHRGDGADRRVGDLCRFRRLRVARADLARDRAVDRGQRRDAAARVNLRKSNSTSNAEARRTASEIAQNAIQY